MSSNPWITGEPLSVRLDYVWPNGCSQSASVGLGCGVGCTSALSVTHSAAEAAGYAARGAMPLPLACAFTL